MKVKIEPYVAFGGEVLYYEVNLPCSLFSFGMGSPMLRGKDPFCYNFGRATIANEKQQKFEGVIVSCRFVPENLLYVGGPGLD